MKPPFNKLTWKRLTALRQMWQAHPENYVFEPGEQVYVICCCDVLHAKLLYQREPATKDWPGAWRIQPVSKYSSYEGDKMALTSQIFRDAPGS
jgi:hypothetical protein